MVEKRKKFTPHSEEVIAKIAELSNSGMRSKDISKQSPELIGYKIKQSSISNILSRLGIDAKANTYRVKRNWHPRKKQEINDFEPYKSPLNSDYVPDENS
jgi:hypothetical protein